MSASESDPVISAKRDPKMDRRDGQDDWIFDPAMAAINRSLKRELRDEAEEVETIVAESELRARTFADVALEIRNRGEIVVVATSHRAFTGQIVYAAGDFVTMRTESMEVDINLADVAYMRVVETNLKGGKAGEDGPGTFEMRLMERRSPHDRVEIGFRQLNETVIGKIVTVGQDHAVVTDDQGRDWTAPLPAIAYVVRKGPRPLK
jgi:hypothetical protein